MGAESGSGAAAVAVAVAEAAALLGFDRFVRRNPHTDRFQVLGFHHVEFWCGDASNTWRRFSWGLGMQLVAQSDLSTGNSTFASYVVRSGDLRIAFTAPYGRGNAPGDRRIAAASSSSRAAPLPGFDAAAAMDFFNVHGLGVRAVGLHVADAAAAFDASVENGAPPVLRPSELVDESTGAAAVISEVGLYGDVVLRYVSFSSGGSAAAFLPNFEEIPAAGDESRAAMDLGIRRLDHAVGNVPNLAEAAAAVARFTGFHEFAEFTAEDVGTAESGLNSLVLASNNEMVLLPMNEPVHGTKRRSQIQTYLDHNAGAGLQHLALLCNDIFVTLKGMRMRSSLGGFEFMPSPSPKYYRDLPGRIGDALTPQQIALCEELGILVDKDDQGVLLQIFTKPVGDRPTLFLEIIQRIGCMEPAAAAGDGSAAQIQKGGCGGFGKGNFAALFKSIEDYERTLE